MKSRTKAIFTSVTASLALAATVHSAPPKKSGPGITRFDADVTEWSSDTVLSPSEGIYPIGGSGQLNGGFVTAERYGIQIGIRAQQRFIGPLPSAEVSKIGVYMVETGESSADRAWWNYDWHVDLRGAKGVAKGKTLGDYDLHLVTDITDGGDLFGLPVPLDLTFGGAIPDNAVLYQSSQNPIFGNDVFDLDEEAVYEFCLVLTPKTFNGPSLIAAMEVVAADPIP